MTTPFLASDALVRVARLRALIGVVTAALLALGPYDRFFVDLAPLLYSAREPVLPSLGAAFPVIRWLTVVLGLAVACGVRPAFTVPALALGFATVTGYVAVFVERSWSYNTHLLFVLLALSLAPTDRALSLVPDRRGGDRARDAELASFALWFSSLCIGLVYLQSGVAKGLGGGAGWFVDGTTAWSFTVLDGTAFGRWLGRWPGLFDLFHLLSGAIELAFLPMIAVRRLQPVAALLAVAMHVGIGAVMGIWFWHLWLLFPPLFLHGIGSARRAP